MSKMNSEMKYATDWNKMAEIAWTARENSRLIGKTAVGAAVMSSSGKIFPGCNVEHKYRCHDVHAEVNAITNMIVAGEHVLKAILIVAKRDMFTPCGGCMDWIFEMGGGNCLVAFSSSMVTEPQIFKASELMPHYPE